MKKSQKLANFIEYLQKGGELSINGRTYVWLNNYPTQVIDGVQYGIDGLAIKTVSISNDKEEPYYLGQADMPLRHFLNLVDQITEEDWIIITSALVLQEMKKERT